MEHKRTVQRNCEEVYKTTCDRCDVEIRTKTYEVDEVELHHKSGDCYPEGSSSQMETADICGKCWSEVLVPALKAVGVRFRIVDTSW